jgi:hypothetical protein
MKLTEKATAALMGVMALLLPISQGYAADYVLLIGGLGGGEKYTQEFGQSLTTIRESLVQRHGYSSGNIRLLLEDDTSAFGADQVATRQNIELEFTALKDKLKAEDTLLLILVGHGQSDYREPKFNLPGPDLSAQQLALLLNVLPARDQRLILAFPCSGHFTEFLGNPQRTILASCDGPRQIYHSVMPRHLVAALESNFLDTNLDNTVDFQELFLYLSDEVEGHYMAAGQLQTENPALEDNGDGEVTTLVEGMDSGDGTNAEGTRFSPAPSAPLESQTESDSSDVQPLPTKKEANGIPLETDLS